MILAAALAAVVTTQTSIAHGVFLYYAYARDASVAAFAKAAEQTPTPPLAYWGEALAYGPDLNTPMTAENFARGKAAIERAQALAANATPAERPYIDAMSLRYAGTWDNWTSDDAAYRQAMVALASSSPNDPNAQLLAAEALLEHGEATKRTIALIDGVLARFPNNAMANHLCIHAYDNLSDRSPALPCAQRLDTMALPPEAEHLAHMPAHFWIESGDYAKALASSERAYQMLLQLDAAGHRDLSQQRYASHDISVGYEAAMMLGNYATATRWANRLNGLVGAKFAALTALRFGRYADAAAAGSDELSGQWIAGAAAIHLGRLADAKAAEAATRKQYGTPTRGYIPQLFFARLAEAEGNDRDARAWLDRARDNQRADFYAEIIPFVPAGEALGGYLLRTQRYPEAIAAFDDCLARYPNDPRALFGLAQALAAQGKTAEAAQARSRFDAAWAGADTTLSIGDL
ncbi:MAG TPA: tetratricopeptide repeat protein [Candidatus Baltobacteraceae bacterium]